MATYARWERPALIENGAGYLVLATNVYCEVRTEAAGNALADLFEDRDGATPLANPFLATDGVPAFHVAGGSYQVRFYKTGYDETFRYQAVGTAAEVDADGVVIAIDPSVDNAVPRFDGTLGQLQGSAVTISDAGNIVTPGTIASVSPFGITASGGNVVSSLQRTDTHGSSAYLALLPVYGKDSAGNVTSFVRLDFYADDATDASEDGSFRVTTIVAGTAAERLKIAAGLSMTGATGGDKGAGTINATAVYDDNSLLSCYVFDAALDGAVDLDKWDGKVPGDRLHEDARRFAARLGTDTDPLDLDSYIAHWREKRHLTALPNEARFDAQQGMPTGAWIQRLIETVETQAVHIAQLHERLKALEER